MTRSKRLPNGRVYYNKNKIVFVATGTNGGACPTVSAINLGNKIKFRDDYNKGFKISRKFVKLIFK
ncbi:MAG: hypothetical protein ABR981_05155 [Candidatus Micrarchaeaceae archaeon]